MELDIIKWENALSEIQFPNSFYTIRYERNIIIKQYLSTSRDELSSLCSNEEDEGNKEQLEKIRNAVWKQDYIYQVPIEVLPGIYDNIEQILFQTSEHKRT